MAIGYHRGEIRVQERAGVRDIARRREGNIHAAVSPQAQRFLEQRRMVVLGTIDPEGRPWASVLTGEPGFAEVLSPRTIRIAAAPASGDPLVENLRTSEAAGMIAAYLARRARIRVNGRAKHGSDGAILIQTDQVYANCPKYIQARTFAPDAEEGVAVTAVRSRGLTEAQRSWIHRADTFFIATANPGEGADASHRGGMPGFVRVEGNRLTWPDYTGNSMFCTLGNIDVHPGAGLVFLDFDTGATLQITGMATINWDPAHAVAAPGAERLVILEVHEVVEIRNAFALRLHLLEYSPFNPEPWTSPL